MKTAPNLGLQIRVQEFDSPTRLQAFIIMYWI